jgi:hypothetical protein
MKRAMREREEELAAEQPSPADRLLARMDLRDALAAELRAVIARVSTEDAERVVVDMRCLLAPLFDAIDEIRDRSDAQFEAIKGVGYTVGEVRGRSGNLDARMTRLIEAVQRPQGQPDPDDAAAIAALSPEARLYFQAARLNPAFDRYTLMVAYYLAQNCDRDGETIIESQKMEAALGLTKKGVINGLSALFESGWMTLIPEEAEGTAALQIPRPWKDP